MEKEFRHSSYSLLQMRSYRIGKPFGLSCLCTSFVYGSRYYFMLCKSTMLLKSVPPPKKIHRPCYIRHPEN